ncbi:unnamed protein product [Pieris macdunnoughi]|uniref:Uncharacterized protein n=1 Tax=Pieris macdunnoughi TaxID=345717 RepID=A0A821WNS8_9NEOP|nr:unnamed protein product [Pieris macdunnoughi]
MIPEPSEASKGEVLKTKMTAHSLHKALSAMLLSKVQDGQSLEELNKLLIEYVYRGSNITYNETRRNQELS